MSDLTSKERPVFVPAVRKPKLPYLCAGAECVTCKRPVYGDWGLVPDECDTCDAERRARYYRECAQWADAEIYRLTKREAELVSALEQLKADHESTIDLYNRNGPQWTSRETGNEYYDAAYVIESANEKLAIINASLLERPPEATGLQCEKDGVCALVSRNDDEWHCTACNGDFVRKQPVEPPPAEATGGYLSGWVIEGAWSPVDRPEYWVGSSAWSTDPYKALRLATRESAQQAADLMCAGVKVRIACHEWAMEEPRNEQ